MSGFEGVKVLFEDDQLLAVVKPAGMVVNRADTVAESTLQDWVEKYLGIENKEVGEKSELEEVFFQRSGIAHRLDKETSGVMIIGKNAEALKKIMSQFKERETKKEYLALVHGLLQPNSGVINLPLGRSIQNRHRFCVDVFGKPSITEYRVERVVCDKYSLVRLFPKTGRTHQIRVHMMHLGHPLVGDELYGGRKRSVRDRQWCPRHFLHAAALEIIHPKTGERIRFESDLPTDLTEVLNEIERNSI